MKVACLSRLASVYSGRDKRLRVLRPHHALARAKHQQRSLFQFAHSFSVIGLCDTSLGKVDISLDQS